MNSVELSPESVRLLQEASAAADYDAGMAIVAAFDFERLPAEEREFVVERLNDILNELSR